MLNPLYSAIVRKRRGGCEAMWFGREYCHCKRLIHSYDVSNLFYEGYQCEFCQIYCLKLLLEVILCVFSSQGRIRSSASLNRLENRRGCRCCCSGFVE
ncbi:hypothetical protein SETIT_8G201200v2 [Setaria italica]|uniref:Uncharacterized protein n=1 Tax=Setaria italica TaxID=4555 RepID=A0A368S9P0_SETIT|nr:hypothetical protein SETIT_8G201200v2 [Setaria italica]